jgi:hypothetical protein
MAVTSALRKRIAASSPVPESLEGRVLLSGNVFLTTDPMTIADFTGDGTGDEVVFLRARQARRVLALSGIAAPPRSSLFLFDGVDGSLLGLPVGVTGRGAPLVAVGDFNNDGNADLAVANHPRRNANLEVVLGNGDGSFGAPMPVADAPANVTSLSTADINTDGNLDLLVTTSTSPRRGGIVSSRGDFLPNFSGALADSGDILIAPALSGGAGAESGGGTGTGGIVPIAAGTFILHPGVTAEAGSGVAPLGSANTFGDLAIFVPDSGGGATDLVLLLGNGDGTFTASTTTP